MVSILARPQRTWLVLAIVVGLSAEACVRIGPSADSETAPPGSTLSAGQSVVAPAIQRECPLPARPADLSREELSSARDLAEVWKESVPTAKLQIALSREAKELQDLAGKGRLRAVDSVYLLNEPCPAIALRVVGDAGSQPALVESAARSVDASLRGFIVVAHGRFATETLRDAQASLDDIVGVPVASYVDIVRDVVFVGVPDGVSLEEVRRRLEQAISEGRLDLPIEAFVIRPWTSEGV